MAGNDAVRTTRADRVLLGALYAPVLPISLAVAAAWLVLPHGGPAAAGHAALAGLAAGIAADAALLPRWLRLGFGAPTGMLAGVYAFYSLVTCAVFMGMPVPQLALGFVAGVFAGRGGRGAARVRRTTVVSLAVLAAVSAALALTGPSAAYDVERTLGLPFPVTEPMLLAAFAVGGPLLLAAQWLVTGAGVRLGSAAVRPIRDPAQRTATVTPSTSSRASSAETISTVFTA